MSEEAQYRMKLRDYVNRLQRDPQIDGNTFSAAVSWMNKEFAEMEQEKENTRRSGRMSLRNRLRNLLTSIIPQNGRGVKGVERNA